MILLVCRNLSGVTGGVERMLTNLANALIENKKSVMILTWDNSDENSYFHLDKNITWIRLKLGNPSEKASIRNRIKRILLIRKTVKRFKVKKILCFQIGTFKVVSIACLFMNLKIFALERNSLQRFDYTNNESKLINNFFFILAEKIVVQFESYIKDYPVLLRKKIVSISNFHNINNKLIFRDTQKRKTCGICWQIFISKKYRFHYISFP